MTPDVLVIGAGLAGLTCARELARHHVSVEICEASDGVGGRLRTDVVDGFRLDRGFQVMLSAYPECRRALDYARLELQPFYPGARVRVNGQFHLLGDPWRKPGSALETLVSRVGSLADKFRIASLRSSVQHDPWVQPETTTLERLRNHGFTEAFITRFFRPFLSGIYLETELATSSRMFDFVFHMMAEGETSVPKFGMGEIPKQLAAGLPPGSVRLQSPVTALDSQAKVTVVATDGVEAAHLTGDAALAPVFHGVHTLYFAADHAPSTEGILFLDGDGKGPVNNFSVMSAVSPAYAPPGAALCSATVLDSRGLPDVDLEYAVRTQMTGWFGPHVARWRHLRTYHIPRAVPRQNPPALNPAQRAVRLRDGLYVCGDYRDNASINGAMQSGRRTAESILADQFPINRE